MVSRRTARRWASRLGSQARLLVQLLATLGDVLEAVAVALGLDATRAQFVAAYAAAFVIPPGRRLAALAGHLHRLEPGLRLM